MPLSPAQYNHEETVQMGLSGQLPTDQGGSQSCNASLKRPIKGVHGRPRLFRYNVCKHCALVAATPAPRGMLSLVTFPENQMQDPEMKFADVLA